MRRLAAVLLLVLVPACTLPGRDASPRPSRTARPPDGPDELTVAGGTGEEVPSAIVAEVLTLSLPAQPVRWPVARRLPYGTGIEGPAGEYPMGLAVAEDGLWVLEGAHAHAVRFDERGRVTAEVGGLDLDTGVVSFPGGVLLYHVTGELRRVRGGRVDLTVQAGNWIRGAIAGPMGVGLTFDGQPRPYGTLLQPAGQMGVPVTGGFVNAVASPGELHVVHSGSWDRTFVIPPDEREILAAHVTERAVHVLLHRQDAADRWYVRIGLQTGDVEVAEMLPQAAGPQSFAVGPDDRPWLMEQGPDGLVLRRRN